MSFHAPVQTSFRLSTRDVDESSRTTSSVCVSEVVLRIMWTTYTPEGQSAVVVIVAETFQFEQS